MSIVGLLCLLFALVASLLLVLYWVQRREIRSVEQLSQQVQRIAIGGRLDGRVDLQSDQPEISALTTAVNHLLTRVSASNASENARSTPKLFAELGDRIHEAVLVHRDVILYANRQFATFVGVDRIELVGRRLGDLVPPEYSELVNENLRRRFAGEPSAERYEIEMVGMQGQVSRLEITTAVVDYEGAPALLVTGVEIIPTQTVQQLRLTADSTEPGMHTLALDSLAEAIIATDAAGLITYINPAAERLTGSGASAAIGKTLEDIVGFVDETDRRLLSDPVRQALTSGAPVNLSRRALLLSRANGSERSIELSASPIRNDVKELIGAVVLLHDVTELRGLARQMSYQATHDALTGLVNRREFEGRLEEAIDSGHRGDGQHVLCYLDLDRFKVVNDTSGHLAGDSMLREVAKVLRDAVRDSDTVARLGGDEFGMLLIGCPLEKARQIADDVCRAVGDYRFVWKDKIFNIGVSIGLVEISRESGSLEELFAAADSACYVAKKQGSGRVAVYSARDEALARHTGEIQWLQKLQSALKENRFQLYHQPIVPAYGQDGGGPAMEVFVRLQDEAGHEVPPSEFVRAAERYRLMSLVDRWVVQTTLAALGRGAIPIPANRSVAINVSGQTLGDVQFLEFVVECLDSTGVTPSQVCFEITETAVVANLDHARRFVGVLHGMGCQFALDDFGSGVGSFSNLKNLPMDYLKIDGSFMRNLARDSVNQAMVTAMIKLARTLNFKVIAEQVEDEAGLEAARRMGVDYIQGYVVGRPQLLHLAAA
ncbi:MAG TPA: EAL domain-containing protein [Steroidobacteraceae bacterium]|nr:EAL domain-containing protein [Steroidobacteraceae bacterium]